MHTNKIRNIVSGVWAIDPKEAMSLIPSVLNSEGLVVTAQDQEQPEVETQKVAVLGQSGTGQSTARRLVGLIGMKEPIVKYSDWCSTGMDQISRAIENMANDDSIAAIVLDIDSPGGAADAVQLPSQAILEAKNKKPVLAYCGDGMCASAAYWIASHCDEIYSTFNTDTVGSIGTYVTIMDVKAYYEKEGLPIHEIYATESTEKNLPFREALDGKYDTIIKEYLDVYNENFLTTVKANREGVNEDALKGKLYFANDALEMGLIDGIGSLQDTINRAFELAEDEKYTTNMFGKKTKIEALVSASKEERTPEMFAAAIAELNEAGLNVVVLDDSEDAQAMAELLQAGQHTAESIETNARIASDVGKMMTVLSNAKGSPVSTSAVVLTEIESMRDQIQSVVTKLSEYEEIEEGESMDAEAVEASIDGLIKAAGKEAKPETAKTGTDGEIENEQKADHSKFAHNKLRENI